ncbi:hypothetical protein IP92_05805 [Pseudoduganella flava]|uniref:DUF2946 domain-containing protein n=1 Tax=Pseudoduganella flava TaxID=871742 RepID=A0A562P939_9BURK|nr:hypothetical protein [Pseudoduganella flava]QGZ38047.1 hypothetical protein GO485_02615 [Pseudoduganella flava]TWI40985.1 hypothetical protein IP92_05805 [Pseudoduganella flava]
MAFPNPSLRRLAAPRGWVALWLAAIVFLAQLLAAAHHDHEVAAKSQHCVACALHAQPHAAPPDAVVRTAPFSWILLHRLAFVPSAGRHVPADDYALPPAHAPPAFLPRH